MFYRGVQVTTRTFRVTQRQPVELLSDGGPVEVLQKVFGLNSRQPVFSERQFQFIFWLMVTLRLGFGAATWPRFRSPPHLLGNLLFDYLPGLGIAFAVGSDDDIANWAAPYDCRRGIVCLFRTSDGFFPSVNRLVL
jgi:hypothetical protein